MTPDLLDEFVSAIGEEATLKLLEHLGGTRVYIPHKSRPTDNLSTAVGLEAATVLSRLYARANLRIPLGKEFRIGALKRTGLSNAKIAARLCMSESGVDRAVERLREQGKLPPRNPSRVF